MECMQLIYRKFIKKFYVYLEVQTFIEPEALAFKTETESTRPIIMSLQECYSVKGACLTNNKSQVRKKDDGFQFVDHLYVLQINFFTLLRPINFIIDKLTAPFYYQLLPEKVMIRQRNIKTFHKMNIPDTLVSSTSRDYRNLTKYILSEYMLFKTTHKQCLAHFNPLRQDTNITKPLNPQNYALILSYHLSVSQPITCP